MNGKTKTEQSGAERFSTTGITQIKHITNKSNTYNTNEL